ncbi:MAG TPA: NifU family protein [Tepidisphaeraceae bacterium]|nr:NifU family protein [Tepidisphaeraceae bacterium]
MPVAENISPTLERVIAAIELVRPAVQSDGGDVELIDIVGDTARVRFRGACIGCPSAALTLKQGIERAIKQMAPEITSVIAV